MFTHFRIYTRFVISLTCIAVQQVTAQEIKRDTAGVAEEDTVYADKVARTGFTVVPAMKSRVYDPQGNKTSLLDIINTIPGVRMEERSPGSYRLNIRGSSLRSPFGVRNVKVYWNNIPLTDPGGNTYFNQLAFNDFTTMTFVKSTASVLYGAGTGGQVFIEHTPVKAQTAALEVIGGSYHLRTLLASANLAPKGTTASITYAHNETDGYRKQSSMRRDNFSWTNNIKLNDKQQLKTGILYTNMYYQTPGALTLAEYEADPEAARPAAGGFPSAIAAKAAVFQKNFTAGVTYNNKFSNTFFNETTVYGAYSRIKNSAIRNYEMRNEPHVGGRTAFRFFKIIGSDVETDWQSGGEIQTGRFNVKVFGNKEGNPDTLQTNDDVRTTLYTIFSQLNLTAKNSKWYGTIALSYNRNKIAFKRLSDTPVITQPFAFSNELLPRFAIGKWLTNKFRLTGNISKAFSPPTIAELLPSTGVINTTLKAEKGWNYELICSVYPVRRLQFEASLFSFRLKDALVQRRDAAGADYFINAGGTRQKGIELSTAYTYVQPGAHFFEDGNFRIAYTYNHFRYKDFIKDNTDYSGKTLPGIPANALSLSGDACLKNGIYGVVSYYGASAIFLDDANTATAGSYHLLTVKIGYAVPVKKLKINIYAGADNLLNERYSLGNDINAAAGRYYNAAPRRNYYLGAAFDFKK
ncbi:MAG: TonB-dependent receptor plug domain-containing protein [Niabella sp.]